MPEIEIGKIFESVKMSVKHIAMARKAVEITDGDVNLFDEELNEMCKEWHDKLKDMDIMDFTLFMIDDLMDMMEKEKAHGDK